MNIVYFVTEDNYFLSHRLPIALYAKKLGHEVFVITKITDKKLKIEGYGFKLIPLNFNRSTLHFIKDIAIFVKLIRVFKTISPDVVHNVAIKPIIIGSLASLFCKNIHVVNAFTGMGFLFTSKLTFKYSVLKFFAKFILKKVVNLNNAHSLVQNDGDVDFIKTFFGAKIDKITCIGGSGVDTNYFTSSIKKKEVSARLRVVTTCRMLKDKGVLDFYEAAIILNNRGVPCTCVFVGGIDLKNPSSIGRGRLNRWIHDGIIEYHDYTDNVLSILNDTDIFILASYREGLSKSILEAASFGLPIVSTDIPASKGTVINNCNGFLVPVRNAFDLANAIEKLVFNQNLRIKFGEASRGIVLKNFSEERVCKKTLGFYETIIS
jgi:glycosyltransferase involved in cell wall biosynthesis